MNYNYSDTAAFARSLTKKKSPKASKVLDFVIDKSKRDYLDLCFTYLRWVDDNVDDPLIPVKQKKSFIEHQKNFISQLNENRKPTPVAIEEACITHFAEYALSCGNRILIDEVKNMVAALSMDVDRLEDSGVFSNDELNCYIELMSKSLFNILYNFSLPESGYLEDFYLGTKFTTIALMIRDLEEDFDAGFINIGAQDIEYYNLNIKNIKEDKNLSLWLAERIKFILNLLDEEVALIKYLPFKFRFFTYYSLIYRLPWIIRAKVYNYSLDYISGQTFIKEFETYLFSFLLSLKIFVKGFILSSKKVVLGSSKDNLILPVAKKKSEKYTRKRAFKLWIISHLLVPKNSRKYGYLCFYYLKWVDDFVDSPENDNTKKIEFINNQLILIDALSNDEKVKIIFKEEYFLYHLIKYAGSIKSFNIISEIKNSLKSIQMDAVRLCCTGVFSSKELEHYLDMVVQPVFNLSYYFLFPSAKHQKNDKYIGRFVWNVLILRDFFEDINSGFINISKEEIEEYNLDVIDLKENPNLKKWMKDKYSIYLKVLNEDIVIFKSMPLKIKLFWCPIYPYMIYELVKIREYDYNFGVKCKSSLSKETKVILRSISLSIKFFYHIFI